MILGVFGVDVLRCALRVFVAAVVASFGLGTPASLRAGQPLVTDDAAVVAPHTCQLEAWAHSSSDGHEYWAQPACNFGGDVELSVGGARAYPFGDARSSLIQLQAKAVLFPRADGEWSLGAVAAATRDTGAPRARTAFQTSNVTGLASWYPREDLEIDLNLGVAYEYGSGSFAVAGLAVQYAPNDALQLLGEIFRDEPGRAKFQVGLRGIVVADRFEVYVSYGNRFDATQWFATAGIRLQTPEFIR